MGRQRRRRGRAINGVLLLNKPLGITSNGALQQAKRLYDAAKAGHTGSLDVLASGMLPICFGEATKFSRFLLDADKRYEVTAKLGEQTTTGDREGEVFERKTVPALDREFIERVLEQFHGVISQTPPMYSAIKHQGQPLYKLARKGMEVERKSREIEIYEIKLNGWTADELSLSIHCSKGTYIRTLIEDIARAMGTVAHVSYLHRASSGPYSPDQMRTFEQLEEIHEKKGFAGLDSILLPVDTTVAAWPAVALNEVMTFYMQQGQPVMIPRAPSSGWVRLTSNQNDFLGMGEVLEDGRVAPRRLLQQA